MSATSSLTLIQLLNMANQGYPDEYLSEYYDPVTGKHRQGDGDTLAKFIVLEVRETFDKNAIREQQIEGAHRVLSRAIRHLEEVIRAIQ